MTFFDYLRPVWRFKFVVLIVAVLAAAAAYAYTKGETKHYEASTELYAGQSQLQAILSPATVQTANLADDANFITTPAVANVVRTNLKLSVPAYALLGAITATPSTTSDFITITAQTANPALAPALANGFAAAYLQLSRANLVAGAQTELKAVEAQLRRTPHGSANAAVRQALNNQLGTLEGIIVTPPSVGSQVSPAAVAGTLGSDPTRNAVFAAVLALALGIVASYLFDRRDRRIRSLAELEELFEVPVLATVSHVRRAEPTKEDPFGIPIPLRESLRTLRVNLEIARATREAKVIMVTSALPSEGKSTVVRNLAITYREAGAHVAVVEADLRRPVLAAQFGVDPGPGLSDTLVGDGQPRMQRVPAGVLDSLLPVSEGLNGGSGRLDVLVAGAAPADPTVLLTDERMRRLIASLSAAYDLVLIDSPPALAVSDALALLSVVDGVIIVARAGTITYPAAARLRRTVERVSRTNRVHLVGAVVNDVADEFTASSGLYGESGRASAPDQVSLPAHDVVS